MTAALRTRIAPTPSGFLHPGNGASFVATWCLARAAGGYLCLRIDDLDEGRRRPEFLEDIFRTIDWLGLDYDEGPQGVDDFWKNHSQQLRLESYENAIRQLREEGYLYACTCSRRAIREQSPDGRYPNTCRDRGLPFSGSETAWRLRVPSATPVRIPQWPEGELVQDLAGAMGDFVLRQKNGLPSYQLASVMDDLALNINFIVRGEDLLHSSLAQRYLAELLRAEAFLRVRFWHHPLVLDGEGEKLSKSKGAGALKSWRESGISPQAVFRQAAQWLGLPDQGHSPEEIVELLRARGPLP